MKKTSKDAAGGADLSGYKRLIQDATGAPVGDLALIERIMRDEIFHSTLDWQTAEQLAGAARQARRLLNENRGLYDLENACGAAMFQRMRAESALRENDTPENRAAVMAAEARYQAASASLLAQAEKPGRN